MYYLGMAAIPNLAHHYFERGSHLISQLAYIILASDSPKQVLKHFHARNLLLNCQIPVIYIIKTIIDGQSILV